jgi:hypothetical protein
MSAAKGAANTNTSYLNLGCSSLRLATVKLMDPMKRCMVAPDNPRTCLIEELRSAKDGELPKLLEYHLEGVEFKDCLPLNAMLLAAYGTTSLFQSIRTNALTFLSLQYGVKGLKLIPHQQIPAPAPQSATRSRFSETTLQDRSTEPFKERGIRVLHFHKDYSKHDWQCFIDLNGSGYVSVIGDSEYSVGTQPSLSNLNADTSRSSSISWL